MVNNNNKPSGSGISANNNAKADSILKDGGKEIFITDAPVADVNDPKPAIPVVAAIVISNSNIANNNPFNPFVGDDMSSPTESSKVNPFEPMDTITKALLSSSNPFHNPFLIMANDNSAATPESLSTTIAASRDDLGKGLSGGSSDQVDDTQGGCTKTKGLVGNTVSLLLELMNFKTTSGAFYWTHSSFSYCL